MSEIEELRVFVQLVDSKSSTKAAEHLGLANSAISRRMKDLESRLGVQLVQRTTRRMHLTESGERFYARSKQLLEDLEEARSEVGRAAKTLSGGLKISTPVSFGVSHLMPAVATFMHSHPNIHIELEMSDRRIDLVHEGVDLAIRIGTLTDSSLQAKKLGVCHHKVCASPAFFEIHGIPQTPQALANYPALCYANLKRRELWQYTAADGKKSTVKVSPRFSASNGHALSQAAIAGLGILCEPSFIVEDDLHKGLLKNVLTEFQWFGMGVYAIYPQTRYVSLRVRSFIDFLTEYFAKNNVIENDR